SNRCSKASISSGFSFIYLILRQIYGLYATSPNKCDIILFLLLIYRPELFLGKFVNTPQELKELRFKTIRSHVEIALPKPIHNEFGEIYHSIYQKINNSERNWSKQIPVMIQSYFEDMQDILCSLLYKAKKGGELWLVVANSVYVGTEIPVDLILTEIGTKNGWKLKRIEVLRYIYRRKTKYCGDINKVRESLIVLRKD
ncbi:hypothetical protein EZS27_025871, partial [termite gut metagenome]